MFARFFGGGTPEAADGASAREEEGGGSNAAAPTPQKDSAVASRISKMDSIIRRKLHGSGAQYNMKVVIRGERGVGKSTLWRRLQGLPYEEKYTPTPEIQTTTINNWVYRGSQDVVKVEVWDVVDKGLARGGVGTVPEGEDLEDAVAGLPPDSGPGGGGRSLAVLDAGVVNVYQGVSAIVFMVDPYRPETLDKVEKGLAEAPVNLPTVVLLNFRDKLEEDAVAKAKASSQKTGTRRIRTPPSAEPPAAAAAADSPPNNNGKGEEEEEEGAPAAAVEKSGVSAAGPDGVLDHPGTEQAAAAAAGGGRDDGGSSAKGGGTGGEWDHVVTLETARLMMERVREADEAAGRGSGRRVSLFDCSMKNCFGLRVLYTYLNVPFLELKRQSLLQQARIAGERLEKEYQELAGFIGGHSYGNYMQHLRTSDVDPTAGRSAPAAPPGRPSIASMPPTGESERRGSVDSAGGGGKKDKKKKHHKDKDKDKDKSKKKDKHRHKSGKSRKDEREDAAPEYGGRVTDAKDFAPVAKKAATDELADFFGDSSEGDSNDGLQGRRKVVKAIDRSALASVNAARDDATDSDEMPAPRTSRLKRVTAPTKPAAPAAASGQKPSSTASTIKSPKPAGGGPPGGTAEEGAGGAGPAAEERRRPPQAAEASSAASAKKVAGGDEAKGEEEEEEEKEKEPSGVRGDERGATEEAQRQENVDAPSGEGEGSRGEGEGRKAAAGAEAATTAEEEQSTVVSGGESGVDDGVDLSGADAAAVSSATPAPSQAGEETVAVHEGREYEEGVGDSQAADRESGGGHDQAEDEKNLAGAQDGVGGTASCESRETEVETAGEKEEVVSATASSSPTKQSSPTAQQHLPSEPHDLPQHPETAPNEIEPRQDAGAGAEAVSDDGDDSAALPDTISPQAEDGTAPKANTGPDYGPAQTGGEEGGEGEAAPDTADELPGTTGGVDGGGRGERQAATIEGNVPAAGGSEQAEADSVTPASQAAETDDERDGLGAGEKEEPEGGVGEVSTKSGDGGVGSGAEAEADPEDSARKAVDAEVEVGGATSVAGETTRGDGVDKPGTAAAAAAETPEPEARSGSDVVGGRGVLSAGVAEDFFAGDNSSGDDELYPGAAAAATAGGAAAAGASALATQLSGNDQDRKPPVSAQPPSPRIIASSVQGGFRPPVATQRNEAAATKGEQGLSEAAKAAVAAALANAASATSRRGDDGSKPRKKKKSSDKERRRKRSGSRSAGEEDPGVGSRGSGSVGRSEADGGGGERSKRSSSRRHHRKSAVG